MRLSPFEDLLQGEIAISLDSLVGDYVQVLVLPLMVREIPPH